MPTLQSGTNQANAIFEIVNASLIEILGGQARRVRFAKNPPTVIMLAGLQGAGKTTLAGKLAKFYAEQGNTPLLVASDLQRPNAVTQLQVVGESVNVPVFAPDPGNANQEGSYGGNPVKVAKDGIEFAKSKMYNMVIVDTAGRLGVDEDLMKQARAERDEILKEAKLLKDSIVSEAKTTAQVEGAKLIEKARIEIENQKKAALAELKGQVSALSLDIAERVLRSQLDDKAKQQDLVASLLKDVELN